MGQAVRPLTPATYSMLLAVGSHFIMGGLVTEGDVRNYLWFHDPRYGHCGQRGATRAKRQCLRTLAFALGQPWRRWLGLRPSPERYAAVMALYIADIRRLVTEAFADLPAASGRNGTPNATLEGQLIHCFATAYGWDPERTRTTPIRQLVQLLRCIRAERGEDVQDAGEQEIIAAHLAKRNAELAGERARIEAKKNGVINV